MQFIATGIELVGDYVKWGESEELQILDVLYMEK